MTIEQLAAYKNLRVYYENAVYESSDRLIETSKGTFIVDRIDKKNSDIVIISGWSDEPEEWKPLYHTTTLSEVKPYLKSMQTLNTIITVKGYNKDEPFNPLAKLEELDIIETPSDIFKKSDKVPELMDLLNLWGFDYRGWIEQKLAIDERDK